MLLDYDDFKKIVFENLNASKENGYFEPGEQLHGSSAKDIALDLIAFAEDCEELEPADLIPVVEEWLTKHA